MIRKRSRSTSRYARKRTKYSRSTAARKIQAQFRRRRSTKKNLASKLEKPTISNYNVHTTDVSGQTVRQQSMGGFDITFPNAQVSSGVVGASATTVDNKPGNRTKSVIKVAGIHLQGLFETCWKVPVRLHFVCAQLKNPSALASWSSVKPNFWVSNKENTPDTSKDFLNNVVDWDYDLAFSKETKENYNVLWRHSVTLEAQAQPYAWTASHTQPVAYNENGGGLMEIMKTTDNTWKFSKYLKLNTNMKFELSNSSKPVYPIVCFWWCQTTHQAYFPQAADNDVLCFHGRNTIYWSEK